MRINLKETVSNVRTTAELAEALATAITLDAGADYVYPARGLEAFEQTDPKGCAA